jgi:hypothetical protein
MVLRREPALFQGYLAILILRTMAIKRTEKEWYEPKFHYSSVDRKFHFPRPFGLREEGRKHGSC